VTTIGPFPPTAVPLPADARPTRELLRWVPQLPQEERDRRWDRLRKKMLFAELDALVFLGNDLWWGMGMSNMRYVFQVDSHFGASAIFPMEGEPLVWNAIPHQNRPIRMYHAVQEWVSDFRDVASMAAIADELRQRGLQDARIGLVGFSSTISPTESLLHGNVLALEKLLPGATLVSATSLLQEMRMVKSEVEIEMLRGAGRIARKVVDAMVQTARPGVPEAAVYAEMIRTQIANGGDPNIFNLFSSGPVEHPPDELWHLLHGAEQPVSPTMRPLAEGDIVIAEWHTKYGGYRCHTEYTVYLGKRAPKELQRIWDVSVECLDASREALVVGRTLREAWEMIRAPARAAGLDWVELGFHAMGTVSPDFPSVVYEENYGLDTLNGRAIGDFVLEEGMAFGNNIDLHDSNWKPDVGCMLADFMIVRPGKAECLIQTPRELALVG
jgi:Xaa-Pro aminopeptidase